MARSSSQLPRSSWEDARRSSRPVLATRSVQRFGHLNRPNKASIEIESGRKSMGAFVIGLSISSVRWLVIPEKQFAKPRRRRRWAYKPVSIASKANARRHPKLQARRTPKSTETSPKPPARLNSNAVFVSSSKRRSFANMCPVSRREKNKSTQTFKSNNKKRSPSGWRASRKVFSISFCAVGRKKPNPRDHKRPRW